MRGEHMRLRSSGVMGVGSSPHARGTLREPPRRHVGVGIIPACAGGEHKSRTAALGVPEGSSPHARGAPDGASGAGHQGGIIPACAGSTRRPYTSRFAAWDHPRMRGEHACSARRQIQIVGSSPHARGALLRRWPNELCVRIIPACAGSTRWSSRRRCPPRDHPRMRGEHLAGAEVTVQTVGSSPHARGALDAVPDLHRADGIIPACAGST